VQPELQQTPSTQKPEAQELAEEQSTPFVCFGTQTPPLQ
jgi:hypothetical protein